jgi:FAD:protein FMN transferase
VTLTPFIAPREADTPDAGTDADVRMMLDAMATRFELFLYGDDTVQLKIAGEQALAEIARLERQLGFYARESDITFINARAAEAPVKVEPRLFALLERCRMLSVETDGAFDITVGPLMRAWKPGGGTGRIPTDAVLAEARSSIGYEHLHLDSGASTIRFGRAGMSIDLGGAGMGYAVDEAIAILESHGVDRALLHGGTTSVHALGGGWKIGWTPTGGAVHTCTLRNRALSVSAPYDKSFLHDGRRYGDVMDPRCGCPMQAAHSAAVSGPRSLECDALSTALVVLGPSWSPVLSERFPGYTGVAF